MYYFNPGMTFNLEIPGYQIIFGIRFSSLHVLISNLIFILGITIINISNAVAENKLLYVNCSTTVASHSLNNLGLYAPVT